MKVLSLFDEISAGQLAPKRAGIAVAFEPAIKSTNKVLKSQNFIKT
jgi:hypothetical protein